MNAFFEKVDKIRPAFDVADKVILFICKLLLVFDILLICIAVLGRYVSFVPYPIWSEEIVLTCMAYMAFISAALAIRHKRHIRMTALDKHLPKKLVMVSDIIVDIIVLAFACMILIQGWKYCTGIGSKGFYTSLPWLSKFWQYLPVPAAGFAMIIFQLETMYVDFKKFFIKESDAE